ncbi:hypothetical protein [Lentisalinibacter sediminis]|uniref:hypothetical protein n=1 Tax=Lentisalinibacter sediminis TaxID=2992237 RepID=UPI00386B820C
MQRSVDTEHKLITSEHATPLEASLSERVRDFQFSAKYYHFRQSQYWASAAPSADSLMFVTQSNEGSILATSLVECYQSLIPGVRNAVISRGPIFENDDAVKPHLQGILHALEAKCCSLQISPFVPINRSKSLRDAIYMLGFRPSKCSNLYTHTVIAPVLSSQDEQRKLLRRSFRTSINKAKKAGVVITEPTSFEDYLKFCQSFNSFAERRGIAPLHESTASAIHTNFATETPRLAFLIRANLSDICLGAILLVRQRKQLVYEWGWTAPSKMSSGIPVMHSLLFRAFEIARQENISQIDLGGYWNDLDATSPINHFKLGISKNIVEYMPEYYYAMSPIKYGTQTYLRRMKSAFNTRLNRHGQR